jgi:signal transduction histidine kinase
MNFAAMRIRSFTAPAGGRVRRDIRRSRTWPLVALAFAAMILLGALGTWVTLNRTTRMRSSVLAVTDAHQIRHEHIQALRSQIYVSSIVVRDYLHDTSREHLDEYRAKLLENESAASMQVAQLSKLASPRSEATVRSLAAEVNAYWSSLHAILQETDTAGYAGRYRRLRTDVIPRREAVIALAEELAELSSSEAQTARQAVNQSMFDFHRSMLQVGGLTVLITGILAAFTTVRVARLENASAAEHLRVENAEIELRRLSKQLVESQEQERRALSRELHDDVGQMLTALRLGLSDLERECGTPTERFAETMRNSRAMLEQTMEAIRDLAMGLRPSVLDDLGLGAAIEWQAREFSRRFDIPVTVDIDPRFADWPEPQRTALYRITQEALTNCARHAHAKSVRIELAPKNDFLVLAVSDDGRGISDNSNRRGFGILGMEERVREIGGQLAVSTREAGGTVVEVRIPWSGAAIHA